MRIGICSDTHGEPLPEFPSDCEVVLHAGDLYDFDEVTDPGKADGIAEQLGGRKVLLVRGNHDITDSRKLFSNRDLSGIVARIAPGMWVAGIGRGCGHRDFHGDAVVMTPTESGLMGVCGGVLEAAMGAMRDGDQVVLLTHYPARLPGKRKAGEEGFFFDSVFKVCEALRPAVVVQGHTHNKFGKVVEHDGMTFVWPGPAGMTLDLTPEGQVRLAPRTRITDRRGR
jgi:calcineurin-like phosphoesterase family protein